jgi:hypothetical protein
MEQRIGEAAGKIWSALSNRGPMRKAALARRSGVKGALLDQAIGWLAREDKVSGQSRGKGATLSLKT